MDLMLGRKGELPMLPGSFETSRVRLRPVAVEDAEAIFDAYAQDEEVVRYLIWRPHHSLSETQAYVERCIGTPPEVERTYMLVGREDHIVRGAFALRQRASHRLGCGDVLARRWWRQGLMTEVLTEVTAWALRQGSVFRIGAGATWIMSARPECWKKQVSSERDCCGAGCCTRTSATSRAIALATPACVEGNECDRSHMPSW